MNPDHSICQWIQIRIQHESEFGKANTALSALCACWKLKNSPQISRTSGSNYCELLLALILTSISTLIELTSTMLTWRLPSSTTDWTLIALIENTALDDGWIHGIEHCRTNTFGLKMPTHAPPKRRFKESDQSKLGAVTSRLRKGTFLPRNLSYDVQIVKISPSVFAQLTALPNPPNPMFLHCLRSERVTALCVI